MEETKKTMSLEELESLFYKLSTEQKKNFLSNLKKQIETNSTKGKIELYNKCLKEFNREKRERAAQEVEEKTEHIPKRDKKIDIDVKKAVIDGLQQEKQEYTVLLNMIKRNIKKIGVVVVILVVLFGIGGKSDLSTPEKAIKSFVKACIKEEYNKASKIFPYESNSDASIYEIHDVFDGASIEKIEIEEINTRGLFNGGIPENYYRVSFEEYEDFLEIEVLRENNKYYILSVEITNTGSKMFEAFSNW